VSEIFVRLALFLLIAVIAASSASSADTDFGSAEFLPGWQQADGTHVAAVRIRLNPGWKTYWRVPGAAGIPPSFNWIGSQNFAGAEVQYPSPEVLDTGGVLSVGYRDEVVFPIVLRATQPGLPIELVLDFNFGACDEICIPVNAQFTAVLGPRGIPENHDVIRQALASVPQTSGEAGVLSADCSLQPNGQDFVLRAQVDLGHGTARPSIAVVETGIADVWVDIAATHQAENLLVAEAPLVNYGPDALVLERARIRLTLIGGGRAIDILGCPAT
jgi:DsbC/DsbD-like thiol-disulfide interchange protein